MNESWRLSKMRNSISAHVWIIHRECIAYYERSLVRYWRWRVLWLFYSSHAKCTELFSIITRKGWKLIETWFFSSTHRVGSGYYWKYQKMWNGAAVDSNSCCLPEYFKLICAKISIIGWKLTNLWFFFTWSYMHHMGSV